jgi:4-alpha-glucanotransferase
MTWLFSAPVKCFSPSAGDRSWGVFTPLYALHSGRSWGAGDFGELAEILAWVGRLGGKFVGTLPLLPAFLIKPCEPSPYSPVSRLFWNEFYLDLAQVSDLDGCPDAVRLMNASAFQAQLEKLRREPLIHYAEQMALKRQVLAALSRSFFAGTSSRWRAFEQFLRDHPHAEDYARFRAVHEQLGEPWPRWPERLLNGDVSDEDCPLASKRYHLYVQWLAHEQLNALSQRAHEQGVELYLDLPLGTHRDGYDVWRFRDVFARGASGGAPPDPVFTQGQDWGFAPLHPQRSREQGHAYFIACLRHHLRCARMLRLDHVMGLHRLFWVPAGLNAEHGAYVTYPAQELYAILCIESHRHRALIVGENLGTVPPIVHRALHRHGVAGMFVSQYEFRATRPALRRVPANTVASLNTHDMPPFQAYWQGLDIADRRALGLVKRSELGAEHRLRKKIRSALTKLLRQSGELDENSNEAGAVSRAALSHLAASPARRVLVTLEDLWQEILPQNVPGTSTERINWRRKTRLAQEQFQNDPAIVDLLGRINRLRCRRRDTGQATAPPVRKVSS